MVRYILSFSVSHDNEEAAKKIIRQYFDSLDQQGPGGMRSQCYSDDERESHFVHIKSFVKDSVAKQHFRSPIFREYINQLSALCESKLMFTRLCQEKTFESIY